MAENSNEDIDNCYAGNFRREDNKVFKKALVKSSKWRSILEHLSRDEELNKKVEDEKQFKEYLKKSSEKLKNKWPIRIFDKTTNERIIEEKQKSREKIYKVQQDLKIMEEAAEKIRQENIGKAQKLIQQLKPKNRELDSAAITSKVLKSREVQKCLNAKINNILSNYEQKENEKREIKNNKLISEQQRNIMKTKIRNESYRCKLLQHICEERQRKSINAKKTLECEKLLMRQLKVNLIEESENKKKLLKNKSQETHKNCSESIKMIKQKRLREKMEQCVENKIIDIFNEEKQNVAEIRRKKEQEMRLEKLKKIDVNAKKLLQQEKYNEEQEKDFLLEKDMKEFNLKLDAKKNNYKEKIKRQKAELFETNLKEIERQKLMETIIKEDKKYDIANRLKNEEVNKEFYNIQTQTKYKKIDQLRSVLSEQVKNKKLQELKEKTRDTFCNDHTKSENNYFVEYADKLVKNAKSKCQPIWPIIKVINTYKN